MDEERGKFQFAGLKFLFDLELVDDPQLVNHLKINVLDVSNTIRDVEFLSSYHHKSMLIFVDLTWFGRKFLQKRIEIEILERMNQMLPNFKFRVVSDRKIFDLALEKVKSALRGNKDENISRNTISNANSEPSVGATSASTAVASSDGKKSDVLQNSKTKTND